MYLIQEISWCQPASDWIPVDLVAEDEGRSSISKEIICALKHSAENKHSWTSMEVSLKSLGEWMVGIQHLYIDLSSHGFVFRYLYQLGISVYHWWCIWSAFGGVLWELPDRHERGMDRHELPSKGKRLPQIMDFGYFDHHGCTPSDKKQGSVETMMNLCL